MYNNILLINFQTIIVKFLVNHGVRYFLEFTRISAKNGLQLHFGVLLFSIPYCVVPVILISSKVPNLFSITFRVLPTNILVSISISVLTQPGWPGIMKLCFDLWFSKDSVSFYTFSMSLVLVLEVSSIINMHGTLVFYRISRNAGLATFPLSNLAEKLPNT